MPGAASAPRPGSPASIPVKAAGNLCGANVSLHENEACWKSTVSMQLPLQRAEGQAGCRHLPGRRRAASGGATGLCTFPGLVAGFGEQMVLERGVRMHL